MRACCRCRLPPLCLPRRRAHCCAALPSGAPEAVVLAAERATYRATLSYDGTGFAGFQRQKAGVESVQGALEAALSRLLVEPPASLKLAASSRTDAGVHATGQVVSWTAAGSYQRGSGVLTLSLNGLLPPSVRVTALAETHAGFSARFDAVAKTYVYTVDASPEADPMGRHGAYHVFRPLDVAAMRTAASLFLGDHDFTPFSQPGSVAREPRRLITACEVEVAPRGDSRGAARSSFCGAAPPGAHPPRCWVRVRVTGSGFLYRQVRCMVGALLAVGLGWKTPTQVGESLQRLAPPWPVLKPAPAKGLSLERVFYEGDGDAPPEALKRWRTARDKHNGFRGAGAAAAGGR